MIGDAQLKVCRRGGRHVGHVARHWSTQEIARGEAMFSQLQQSVEQMGEKHLEISAHVEAVSENLAQRGQAILDAQSSELIRQAESVEARMAERFQSALQATGRQTEELLRASSINGYRRKLPASKKRRASLRSTASRRSKHLPSIRSASGRLLIATCRTLLSRGKVTPRADRDGVRRIRLREAISRWTSELESKATETSQGTFEALYKSADWYEKKVQNQMQTTLQKGVDQAAAHLREKTGFVRACSPKNSTICSRSYVEHAQRQIQECANEASARASEQIAAGSDAAAAGFQRTRRGNWRTPTRNIHFQNAGCVRTECREHGSEWRPASFEVRE